MPTIIIPKAPVVHDYKEPGEFINAWRRFTLGKEVPPPTADGVPLFRELATLIVGAADRFMQTRRDPNHAYFWSTIPHDATLTDIMSDRYLTLHGNSHSHIGDFISDQLGELLATRVAPMRSALCKRKTSLCRIRIETCNPTVYECRRYPEMFGPLDFGPPCVFPITCRITFNMVPPRCVNSRNIIIGAPRDLVAWTRQFPGGVDQALAWLAVDASRAYSGHRFRGTRNTEYVPGSDPHFWVPTAGKALAHQLAPQLHPFVRTNP